MSAKILAQSGTFRKVAAAAASRLLGFFDFRMVMIGVSPQRMLHRASCEESWMGKRFERTEHNAC
ncbi:MAG: hypothetical protein OXI75_02910 [Rhodospirillales bacterium]|nr:hypothetical protein [Rhodospirillales bacterium]